MGKLFNETMMRQNFPFKRVSLGPEYAEERRGNLKVRRQSEQSGDLPPIGRDEGETEQDNPDTSRLDQDGPVREGLPRKSGRPKAGTKRQGNRKARRGN